MLTRAARCQIGVSLSGRTGIRISQTDLPVVARRRDFDQLSHSWMGATSVPRSDRDKLIWIGIRQKESCGSNRLPNSPPKGH